MILAFVTVFSILLIQFYHDFTLEFIGEENPHLQPIFANIVLQTLITIEWIHFVCEKICCSGKNESDADRNDDEAGFSRRQQYPKKDNLPNLLNYPNSLHGAICCVVICASIVNAHMIYHLTQDKIDDCTNFTIKFTCSQKWWFLLPTLFALLSIAFLIYFMFYSSHKIFAKRLSGYFEYQHLRSASIMYLCLVLMDFFYTFFVNNSYFIILLRHACVYAVLMMTTL